MIDERPRANGKFIVLGVEKLYICGVTYGTFRLNEVGEPYPSPIVVEQDFAQMAANGVNAVRTYTVPPRWFLDAALQHGLRVMVGLPWEQHIAFLEDAKTADSIESRVRMGVRACAGHPAILCYAVGNEIPSSVVRWYGHRPIERFIERLYRAAKAEDPEGLVTYVNYPSTEYLHLPFVDVVCFNVYLEEQERFEAYLARLQNIAGDRPLIMAEIGIDSRSHGEDAQAEALDWQVRTAFAGGCAGAFVFAWTDEWHRGGEAIEDWDFGLVDRERRPKPALAAAHQAFADAPFPPGLPWPRISVVVCSHNGERTIRECLDGLLRLEYRDFEVIVVDDGSTDATAAIAREYTELYPCKLITTRHAGLSNARNLGLEAATGEIIAYIDDDAYPDPHWLMYLAVTFMTTSHVAVGGPNIAPSGDGVIADCVANAPGNPTHILLSDQEAEHLPGCNMAFRIDCLQAVGGFDRQFRVAGDDVDVCWRLQQRGWTLGFSPGAMVWHHRRRSIGSYWRQQRGYGQAEALLERKWPERYNPIGSLAWAGRIYGKGLVQPLSWSRGRIHHGIWGTALFQSVYQPASDVLGSLLLMPEWHLLSVALAALLALNSIGKPLLLALLLLTIGAPIAQAGLSAAGASFTTRTPSALARFGLYLLTAFLHLLQPIARLCGRLHYGLSPWRRRAGGRALPWPQLTSIWSERWRAPETWLHTIETVLRSSGAAVLRGGPHDRWDLEARGGIFGVARLLMAIEEHGQGMQLARFRIWPRYAIKGPLLALLFAALTADAALEQAWGACAILGGIAFLIVLRMYQESAAAIGAIRLALRATEQGDQPGQPWHPPIADVYRVHPAAHLETRDDGAWIELGSSESGSIDIASRSSAVPSWTGADRARDDRV